MFREGVIEVWDNYVISPGYINRKGFEKGRLGHMHVLISKLGPNLPAGH